MSPQRIQARLFKIRKLVTRALSNEKTKACLTCLWKRPGPFLLKNSHKCGMLKILVICAASFSRKQPRLQAEQCFRVLLPECSWVYSYGSCGQDWFFETQITEIAADTAIVAFVWIFCALFEHFTCEDRHKKAMNQHLGPWLCVFCFYFRLGFRCNLCIFYHILMFAKESKHSSLHFFQHLLPGIWPPDCPLDSVVH